MAIKRPPIIKDAPFVQQSGLTGRWYFVASYRQISADTREAHVKHDITDAIEQITAAHDAEIRRDQAAKLAAALRARLQRPVRPYGDARIRLMPEVEFARDAYGEELFDDIEAILAQFTSSPEEPSDA